MNGIDVFKKEGQIKLKREKQTNSENKVFVFNKLFSKTTEAEMTIFT